MNHLLHSGNLDKVLLTEITIKTKIKKFDSIQQSKIPFSKWKVVFFFTLFLFEKCLVGIEIAQSYLNNVSTAKMTDELRNSTLG